MPTFQSLFEDFSSQLSNANIPSAKEEVFSFMSEVFQCDKTRLIRDWSEEIQDREKVQLLSHYIQRRCEHEPFAYILGKKEFYGRDFSVGPGALVPRPETEHLIEAVLEYHQNKAVQHGVDLCCGPGTVGLTLASELKCPFDLADMSPDTLKYCYKNIENMELSELCKVFEMNVLEKLPESVSKADVITMNPPYVAESERKDMEKTVLAYEPEMALFGGGIEGLEFTLKTLKLLEKKVKKGTHLFIELGYRQKGLLESQSLYPWVIDTWKVDLAGIPRIVQLFLD